MSYIVTIANNDIAFECADGEAVLDAAERAGYSIPYSCRKGVCSSCAGQIVKGEARVRGQGVQVGPADGVLLCQAHPLSDLEIAPTSIRKVDPVQRKTFDAKVRKVARPTSDVVLINLRLPIGSRASFRAGQYLRVMLDDGDSRNYSMANPPQRNDEIELHIRHVPGGKFSETVLSKLDKGSVLTVELPYGEFSLTGNTDRKAILLASGTGFAPMKSLIENQLKIGQNREIHLYWGVNRERDLYMADTIEEWAAKNAWFSFTPVVSSPSHDWRGRSGFVHNAVLEDNPDMAGVEVYACGAPVMIEAARTDFVAKANLTSSSFFSDAFVPSGNVG